MADNTGWLEKSFGGYDLLHLDPLLLDLEEPEDGHGPGLVLWSQIKEAVSGISSWGRTDESAPEPGSGQGTEEADPDAFLRELVTATGLSLGSQSLMEFFDSGGLLDRLRSDHDLRAEIVGQVESAPKRLAGPRSLSDVASTASEAMSGDREDTSNVAVGETGDDGQGVSSTRQPGSVIVIQDTILNKIDRIPPEMVKILKTPHLDDGRRLGYMLSDRPFRLLTLDRPAVPLVVNGEAADRWAPEVEQFFAAGWYPCTRVLGRYRVTGGRPYIDALAVLAKRYPPIHQILLPQSGSEAEYSLQKMLDGTVTMIEEFQGSDQETAVPKPSDSEEGAAEADPPVTYSDTAPEGDPYKLDHQLLYPLLLFGLCCEVNGVDLALLKSRAHPVYAAYQLCVSKLVQLGSDWENEGQAGPLVDMVRQGRGKTLPIFTMEDKPEQHPRRALRTR